MINFKCTASEGSGATLESEVLEAIPSILALAVVTEILQLAATGLTNAAILQKTPHRYMDLFVACYGEDQALPNHHFARHLSATWERLGFFCLHVSCMSADTEP